MFSRLPLLLVAVALPADAGVYKCSNDKGGVIYQDAACAPGKELRNLDIDPATVSVVPATPVPGAKLPPASTAKPARAPNGTITAAAASAAQRKFLETGMSEADVMRKVGRPDVEIAGRTKEDHRWLYLPTEGDRDIRTTLTLAGGKVVNVERKVVR